MVASAAQMGDHKPTSLTLIVDAGSGFTRAAVWWRDGDGLVHASEAHAYAGQQERWKEDRIVDVLVTGGEALRGYVESIRTLGEQTGCFTTLIGATGGLRQAELDGKVLPAMMEALEDRLCEVAPSVRFRRLSGNDEAGAELTAVQYCAEFVLPVSVPRQTVGMLSGGGMTAQVGYRPADGIRAPLCLSLTTNLNGAAQALFDLKSPDGAARRRALQDFASGIAAAVEATGVRGSLCGTFSVIEMVGALGHSDALGYDGLFAALAARIGRRLISKYELATALREHVEAWQAATAPFTVRTDAYGGLLPTQLLGLLELMDDSAQFFVSRSFEIAPGQMLKPSWSLGLFLEASKGSTAEAPVSCGAPCTVCLGAAIVGALVSRASF